MRIKGVRRGPYRKKVFMNNYLKKTIVYIIMLIIGLSCIVAGILEVADSYVSGFGCAFVAVAATRLAFNIKYRNDSEYAKQVNVSATDERVLFISGKAKSWAFYLTTLISALAGVALHIAGFREYGTICSMHACLLVLIYWIAYYICGRKY